MNDTVKPFHIVSPGEVIVRMMEYMGWSQTDLAEITGLSDKTVSYIVSDKHNITADTAVALANAFSKSPEFFMNLSANYQLSKRDEKKDDKTELTKAKALMHKYMPVSEMKKKGWFVSEVSSAAEITNEYERLFGQRTLPEDLYESNTLGMAARQTKDDSEYTKYYRTTWFSFARMHAKNIQAMSKTKSTYDALRLKSIADKLAAYTLQPDGVERLISDLQNHAGVHFFVLSHLSKTYLDGAAFLEGGTPFIVYTGRYDREDNFWFVIAHEIAHILCHYAFLAHPFLDDMEDAKTNRLNKREQEADAMAGAYLKQKSVLRYGSQIGRYVTEDRLYRISGASGVSVSVALGMLQHAGMVSWKQFSRYKPKVMDKIPKEYIKG